MFPISPSALAVSFTTMVPCYLSRLTYKIPQEINYITTEYNKEELRSKLQIFSQFTFKISKSFTPAFKWALFKCMPQLNYKFSPVMDFQVC